LASTASDIVSPFIVGNPVTGPEMFFGREDIFADVARALRGRHRDNVVTIHGQPRTGKTSVLYQLPRYLGDQYFSVLVDVHALALDGLSGFLWELARYLIRMINRSNIASVELPARAQFDHDARIALEELLETVGEQIGQRRLVVMFDEAIRLHDEVRTGRLEPEIFQYLRHLVQRYEWLDFVFCLGVDLDSIPAEFTSVLGVGLYKHVSFLPEDAARELLTAPVEGYYELTPDAQRRVLRLTSCHPYYTQLMGHCLFTLWSERKKQVLSVADVNAALDLALELGAGNLASIWADSSPAERALMAGVALESTRYAQRVSRRDVGRAWADARVQLPEDEVDRAERRLIGREILRDQRQYVFAVDLQRLWVRRRRRLERVRDEIRPELRKWNRELSRPRSSARAGAAEQAEGSVTFTPLELAELYNFPADLDGSGQCIGMLQLGGGYESDDLAAYFQSFERPTSEIAVVSVDGGQNDPQGPIAAANPLVTGSIEICGLTAPGARLVVYFAPNTLKGLVNGVLAAVNDRVNCPSVLAVSWGAPEENWGRNELLALNRALKLAAHAGITVCCAAGDNGSTDGVVDGRAHVSFPASSPWVLACGGTAIKTAGQPRRLEEEVVWQGERWGTGGGISEEFDRPEWQETTDMPLSANRNGRRGRGVPDVAAHAEPSSGYRLRIGGEMHVIGGTALVTPLWAGLIARINQGLGRRVGFINPVLYQRLGPAGVLRNITVGSNGAYDAGPGWNACTGWGVPDGSQLLLALKLIDPPRTRNAPA
jgi:hypothetical protein